MEVGDKMKELNMTVDEMDALRKALQDSKFRDMLSDYARELSDPENKKRYEEEIKLLEQERGNTIEFIHPEPFKALRTSVNGKQKCFINICANANVGKPECKRGVSEQGREGQCWSLPCSLHPGKQDTDPKGHKVMIYDVVFHPETLYIAGKNKRFMGIVDNTAIQEIQKAFKVTLDKNNVREMKTKYKGVPQPCVIRRPIPGYKTERPSEEPGPLAFPYPDEKRPTTSLQTKPTESPVTNNHGPEPKSFQYQPLKAKKPTEPAYTVKYRSFIDLQDFRCSRDSAQSPRPKEIVVTIDLPLLKAATDATLEVNERLLLLESQKPAYRLELPLAYPVDEEKGEAKFMKQRGQLIVTMPVLPSSEAIHFAVGSAETSVSDDERQEDISEVEEQGDEKESEKSEEGDLRRVKDDLRQRTSVEKVEEEGERGQEKGEEQEGVAGEERVVGGEETWREQKMEGETGEEEDICVGEAKEEKQKGKDQEGGEEEEKSKEQKQGNTKEDEDKKDSSLTSFQRNTVDVSAEEQNSSPVNKTLVVSSQTEKQPVLTIAEHSRCIGKEGEVNLNSCLELTPTMKTSDTKEATEKTRESAHGNEVETDAAFRHHRCSEESQTSKAANTQRVITDTCISQESSKTPATDEANKSSKIGSDRALKELATGSVPKEERENADEDDLLVEQIFHNPEHDDDNKPSPALLREIDKDGNEKIISDHSTSAGFIFQNSLMYELD